MTLTKQVKGFLIMGMCWFPERRGRAAVEPQRRPRMGPSCVQESKQGGSTSLGAMGSLREVRSPQPACVEMESNSEH
jgi:hypothetical protein